MTKDNYAKAYKEVLEVLKYVPVEELDKIPTEMLQMFRAYQDDNHEFKIDFSKSFEEQNLMIETKAILANIFRDYWATPYQRERIIAKENYDRQRDEEEKRDKYNPNEIFKNSRTVNIEKIKKNSIETNNLPILIEKKNFFERLIEFVKKFFK